MSINANHYRSLAEAVAEAIDLSLRGDGETVTLEATGQAYEGVRQKLFDECESNDDGDYSGVDVDGRRWTVRLITRDVSQP